MTKVGFVYETIKDTAIINIPRFSGCGGNCKSCSGSCESIIHKIEVKNSIDAKRGDFVEIEYSETQSLKISILVYILPLITFFIGLFLASYFFKMSEIKSLGIGFIGLVVGFIALYFLDKNLKERFNTATILRKVSLDDISKYY